VVLVTEADVLQNTSGVWTLADVYENVKNGTWSSS
jgi:hypothetical protein